VNENAHQEPTSLPSVPVYELGKAACYRQINDVDGFRQGTHKFTVKGEEVLLFYVFHSNVDIAAFFVG
jgi:hypothetical protein